MPSPWATTSRNGKWTAWTSATTRWALTAENKARLHAGNVNLLKSDLFAGLTGRHYELIVTNPPYVTDDETDALPKEYSYEPELGLRAGPDGLDLVLKILRDAPLHLSQDGLLICEVGESERHLIKLLPEVDLTDRVQGRADGHLRGGVPRTDRAQRTHRRAGRRAEMTSPPRMHPCMR